MPGTFTDCLWSPAIRGRMRSTTWERTGISVTVPGCRRMPTTQGANTGAAISTFVTASPFRPPTLSLARKVTGRPWKVGKSTPSSLCRVRNRGDQWTREPMRPASVRCPSARQPIVQSAGTSSGTEGLQAHRNWHSVFRTAARQADHNAACTSNALAFDGGTPGAATAP